MSLPEEDYTRFLIAAVSRRPVLYNVHLAEYKNKNKKGEAFKSVQEEMKQLGCSEQQVQSTYKRWISLKRKFRVEFLKQVAKDRSGREEGTEVNAPSATFPHYDKLTFLVPYCEHYKASKGKGRRRKLSSVVDDGDEDGNDCGENGGAHPMSAMSNILTNTPPISIDPLSLLTPTDIEAFKLKLKCLQHQETMAGVLDGEQTAVDSPHRSSSQTSTSCTGTDQPMPPHLPYASSVHHMTMECDDSENALFGQLVASELDKLPKAMHNLVRAQILFLIAQMGRR